MSDCEVELLAGCDLDMSVKLFRRHGTDGIYTVKHADWIKILDKLGAEPGEMLVVTLSRAMEGSE